jgi:two-component system CheB/CheR fusion protein
MINPVHAVRREITRDLIAYQRRFEQLTERRDCGGVRLASEDVEYLIEELRAANEELHAINSSLETSNTQLARLNADIMNLADNVDTALLLIDADLRIRTFTFGATRIFPLRPQDRGRRLTDLTSSLRDVDLAADLKSVLSSGAAIERETVIDTDHKPWVLLMRVRPCPPVGDTIDGVVLSFFDIDAIASELKLAAIVDSSEDAIVGLDINGIVTSWNPGAERLYGYSAEEMIVEPPAMAGHTAGGPRGAGTGAIHDCL